MVFQFMKVSDHGTANPIVARLMIQTSELIQWAAFPKEKADAVVGIYYGCAHRLLRCYEILDRLTKSADAAIKELEPQADPRVKAVPQITGLQAEAENFLYECKNYLRDLLSVLAVFFDKNFTEASAIYDPKNKGISELAKWATEKFGTEDGFTKMLFNEMAWTGEVICKRNAIEHPGGHSGELHIKNFTLSADGKFVPPSWQRNELPRVPLLPDLARTIENLLTLSEDMLLWCIDHVMPHKFVRFAEIPVSERQQACPMRITVRLSGHEEQ